MSVSFSFVIKNTVRKKFIIFQTSQAVLKFKTVFLGEKLKPFFTLCFKKKEEEMA